MREMPDAGPISMGENIRGELKGNELVLRIDVSQRLRPSRSLKNILVACSGGRRPIAPGLLLNLTLDTPNGGAPASV